MNATYHWWAEECDSPPYSNLRAPILMSIATLRAVNPQIPITVLDMSGIKNDWKHFPQKLDFKVSSQKFCLEKYKEKIKGWKHLSRINDIRQLREDGLMYVDSDVFWFKDPLPLKGDLSKFCFNGWNTGFFYYGQNIKDEFFDVLDAYTKTAIYSHDIRGLFRKHVGYDSWYEVWDEMTTHYMYQHNPEFFDTIPPEEHFVLRQAAGYTVDELRHAKMLHANGIVMRNPLGKTGLPNQWGEQTNSRGLMVLLFKELYNNIIKVLDESDLKMMFTANELEHYRHQQFSFFENIDRLLSTRTEDGHFDIQKCLAPVNLI